MLLPAVLVSRGQHHTIAYNPERGDLKPSDLTGKRVGLRAYTVTTATWVRGILADEYGVDLNKVEWITFEDPHVAEYGAMHHSSSGRLQARISLKCCWTAKSMPRWLETSCPIPV